VREEIRTALASFAEDALRRELEQLGATVRQAFRDIVPPQPTVDDFVQRKDLQTVLEEWWSGATKRNAHPGKSGKRHAKAFESLAPSGERSGSHDSSASVSKDSPPASPFSLPAALSTPGSADVPDIPSPPLATPLGSPASMPGTPVMTFSPLMTAGPSQKDWRRAFVGNATKANRKVEYIHGFQCREAHDVHDVLEEAVKALEDGIKPKLVEDGLGGTYFVKDRDGDTIAVFKPRDEEPLAPNNPKVHAGEGQGSGLKEGVLVGEAAINEFAAYC